MAWQDLEGAQARLADRRSPFAVFCAEHGLGKATAHVLLFIAAPARWGEIARIYAILENDLGRPVCDEHLLWQLLDPTVIKLLAGASVDADVDHGVARASTPGPGPSSSAQDQRATGRARVAQPAADDIFPSSK